MKKYLLCLSTLFFFILSSFYQIPSAYAGTVPEGGRCNNSAFSIQGGGVDCAVGLECLTDTPETDGELWYNGICTKPPMVPCTCEREGQKGAGNNGFTCGDPSKRVFCDDPNYACYPAGPEYFIPKSDTSIDDFFGTPDPYPDRQLSGVRCDSQPQVQCTCNTPNVAGDGNNGMTCNIVGQPNVPPGTGFCDDGTNACIPGGAMDVDGTVQMTGDANGIYNETTMLGVHCAPAPLATPPSPPCTQWAGGECTTFNSAVGALKTETSDFISTLFAVLLSLSGGIALLLIIKAGYQLMTSQGKPESIQAGRDQLIAAIVGLMFLIFSFIFLEVIGYDILRIPGFNEAPAAGTGAGNGSKGNAAPAGGNAVPGRSTDDAPATGRQLPPGRPVGDAPATGNGQ